MSNMWSDGDISRETSARLTKAAARAVDTLQSLCYRDVLTACKLAGTCCRRYYKGCAVGEYNYRPIRPRESSPNGQEFEPRTSDLQFPTVSKRAPEGGEGLPWHRRRRVRQICERCTATYFIAVPAAVAPSQNPPLHRRSTLPALSEPDSASLAQGAHGPRGFLAKHPPCCSPGERATGLGNRWRRTA